jgi:hypothetical protein
LIRIAEASFLPSLSWAILDASNAPITTHMPPAKAEMQACNPETAKAIAPTTNVAINCDRNILLNMLLVAEPGFEVSIVFIAFQLNEIGLSAKSAILNYTGHLVKRFNQHNETLS